jgi:hypothetical protein
MFTKDVIGWSKHLDRITIKKTEMSLRKRSRCAILSYQVLILWRRPISVISLISSSAILT